MRRIELYWVIAAFDCYQTKWPYISEQKDLKNFLLQKMTFFTEINHSGVKFIKLQSQRVDEIHNMRTQKKGKQKTQHKLQNWKFCFEVQ